MQHNKKAQATKATDLLIEAAELMHKARGLIFEAEAIVETPDDTSIDLGDIAYSVVKRSDDLWKFIGHLVGDSGLSIRATCQTHTVVRRPAHSLIAEGAATLYAMARGMASFFFRRQIPSREILAIQLNGQRWSICLPEKEDWKTEDRHNFNDLNWVLCPRRRIVELPAQKWTHRFLGYVIHCVLKATAGEDVFTFKEPTNLIPAEDLLSGKAWLPAKAVG